MSTCLLCGDPSDKEFCLPCLRMRAGAARIFADMHDLAALAQHLCRIGTAQPQQSGVSHCSARVKAKWAAMRRRHTQKLQQPAESMLTREELCTKLGDDVLCSYCHEYPASGLDRVDATKGYTLENTVPCCVLCNFTKSDLSVQVFLDKSKKACMRWRAECPYSRPL